MAARVVSPDASPSPRPRRAYRYYDLVMAAFVTVLLCANLIGASKVAQIGGIDQDVDYLYFATQRGWINTDDVEIEIWRSPKTKF